MGLQDVLASIPGRGAYLAQQQFDQQQGAGQLAQLLGVANFVEQVKAHQAQQALQAEQTARLKQEMALKQQIEDRQQAAIATLPQEQRPLAQIAPQQFVAGQFRGGPTGGVPPEIVKLQQWEKHYRDAGDNAKADQIASVISNREMGGTSQQERAFRTLQGLEALVRGGQQLTPEQTQQAEIARAILSRNEMKIDPVTKAPYFTQPIQIPPSLSVGSDRTTAPEARPGPTNALPPMNAGRAPLDSADQRELNQMGDARALASDLKQAFKPEYGGFVSDTLAGAMNEYGRRIADPGKRQQMAQFWETYEQWITDMRKEKFGATLTGNELEQFNKLRAKPSQTPTQIQNNLNRQLQMVEQSMGRRMTSLARQGVNQEALEGAVGWGVQRPSNLVTPNVPAAPTVKRRGTLDGRRVVEYTDGTIKFEE